MSPRAHLVGLLSDPHVLGVWAVATLLSLALLFVDLGGRGRSLSPLMKLVWSLTVLSSGPVGLAIYAYAGRPGPRETLPRRSFRSAAHCYSGCGVGEVVGLVLAVGVLGLSSLRVAAVTFALAYLAGLVLTVGPLLRDGVGFGTAVRDAVLTETGSIVAMETVAISVDLYLAGEAGLAEPLFWGSLAVSLALGLLAAFPVNALLLTLGVKSGMARPGGA